MNENRIGMVSTSRSGCTVFRRAICNIYGMADSNSWLKKNDYHNNYHKMRKQRDLEYAEKSRRQINDRVKRYCENNKEIIKMKRDEILRKSKLYDEVIKSMTEINS